MRNEQHQPADGKGHEIVRCDRPPEQDLPSPVPVRLGEDTLDEMCLVGLGIIYPRR
jgi:hypothetical protein